MTKMNATVIQPTDTSAVANRDEATAYALAVAEGEIIAGPHVRAACRRHLADLETGAERGLYFAVEAADYAIGFFRHVLYLPDVLDDDGIHVAFEPQPWQAFIIGSLFGWLKADGTRRFATAYVETAKGSGKSPLAAGIGLIGLIADDEYGAEIYSAATKKDQAMILFRDAVRMVAASPHLSGRIRVSGVGEKAWNLAYLEAASFFRPISADDGQSGPRPHIALVDEVHEHKDGYVIRMLSAGQKRRRQPLIFMITNSGRDRLSVCREYHEYGAKVCAGLRDDDSFFAYICANDLLPDGKTEIDPFDHPEEWIKTNPSLPAIPGSAYLEKQIREARGMPSAEATVRRLNFCQWVDDGLRGWLGAQIWMGAGRDYQLADFAGRRAYLGLDISAVHDLTAALFLIEPKDAAEPWCLWPMFWVPKQGLIQRVEKERAPYDIWERDGFIRTCPGAVISYEQMARDMIAAAAGLDIVAAGRDPAMKHACDRELQAAGLDWPWEWQDFRQGFISMGPAIKEMERRLRATQTGESEDDQGGVVGMVHPHHPVLTMCVANAQVVKDAADNIKFEKARSLGRIDGIVAGAIATGMTLDKQEPPSVYESRGIRTL
jgi:phage terminase large subunit-like protein